MQLSCTWRLPYPLPMDSTAPGHSAWSSLSETWQFEFWILSKLRSSPQRLIFLKVLLRTNKKSKSIKHSDRGLDYTVNSNAEVSPMPRKHPWSFMCRNNLGQLAAHSLPQSQFTRGLLQGYWTARGGWHSSQGLVCFPEYGTFSNLFKYSLVSGTTGISS